MWVQEILIPAGAEEERCSVGEENKDEEYGGIGGEGEEEEQMKGGALFWVMQVLEIPARGRGFPLVVLMLVVSNYTAAIHLSVQ